MQIYLNACHLSHIPLWLKILKYFEYYRNRYIFALKQQTKYSK